MSQRRKPPAPITQPDTSIDAVAWLIACTLGLIVSAAALWLAFVLVTR